MRAQTDAQTDGADSITLTANGDRICISTQILPKLGLVENGKVENRKTGFTKWVTYTHNTCLKIMIQCLTFSSVFSARFSFSVLAASAAASASFFA